jgi:hypothetical protein
MNVMMFAGIAHGTMLIKGDMTQRLKAGVRTE